MSGVRELLIAYRYWIGAWLSVAFFGTVFGVLWFGVPGVITSVDVVVLLVVLLFVGTLAPPAGLGIYHYVLPDQEPDWKYIVVTDAFRHPGVWRIDRETKEDMETQPDGASLHQWGDTPVFEARDYDFETNRALCTWRGHAEGSEMNRHQFKVDEIITDYEQKEAKSRALRFTFSSIVRSVLGDYVDDLVESYEEKAIYQGERIQKKIDKATADWVDDGALSSLSEDDAGDLEAVADAVADDIEEEIGDVAEQVSPEGGATADD